MTLLHNSVQNQVLTLYYRFIITYNICKETLCKEIPPKNSDSNPCKDFETSLTVSLVKLPQVKGRGCFLSIVKLNTEILSS